MSSPPWEIWIEEPINELRWLDHFAGLPCVRNLNLWRTSSRLVTSLSALYTLKASSILYWVLQGLPWKTTKNKQQAATLTQRRNKRKTTIAKEKANTCHGAPSNSSFCGNIVSKRRRQHEQVREYSVERKHRDAATARTPHWIRRFVGHQH